MTTTTHIIHLDQCTEFSQTLRRTPPLLLHGVTGSMALMIFAAITWMHLTTCDLVVVTQGRIRPSSETTHVVAGAETQDLGRVTWVDLSEGQIVRKGQPLVAADTTLILHQQQQLERRVQALHAELAQLDQLESLVNSEMQASRQHLAAELDRAKRDAAAAEQRRESQIELAQTELQAAKRRAKVSETLAGSRAISESRRLDALTNLKSAEQKLCLAKVPVETSQVESAERAIKLAEQTYHVRLARLAADRIVKQREASDAETQLQSLAVKLSSAKILSPIDGIVVGETIAAGDVLHAGQAVAEIAPHGDYQFEAIVPSVDIGDIQVGLPVKIRLDAFDDQTYGVLHGTVTSVSPDSSVADDTTQQRVGYRVRVKLLDEELRHGKHAAQVKLGMSGAGEIVIKRQRLLTTFFRSIRQSISLAQ